jgi:integrase
VRFHTLRHTHATLLIASGVDAKTVSERLGHADVATTLRYYGHVMPGRDRQAAARFDEILGNGED